MRKITPHNFLPLKKVYNKKLFNQNGKILVEVVQLFENYRLLYANKNQFISDLFEHFLNEGFTQNEGIYFTPMPITRFIWNALPFEDFINLHSKTFPKVIDFACGAGHFLTEGVSAISDYCKDRLSIEDREISRYFYGIDADDRLAMTSQVSMLLNGAGDNKIRFIDGLEYDSEFYGENQQDFDILVANPPYSVKEFKQHLSRSVLKGKNGNIPYKVLEHLSPNAKEIENVFIERLTHILKPNALCAIILPNSILSNTDKATTLARELILQNFAIHAICSFGSQTFGTTGTNTAVLFLRRFDEPPKKTLLLEDSLNAIFESQNLDNFIDKEILQSYVNFQNIDLESYKAFLKQGQIPSHELFKEYETAFNAQSAIKKYKISKSFNDLDKNAQKIELEKRLFDFIVELEREKLKYFALTYKQNTLIIKAPDDTAEQKRFLGFVINKGKTSNAGLQETEGLLSHRENRNATNKIAYAIKQSFKNEFHTHEAFSKYVSFTQTCKLLNFENAVFNKAISLNPANSQGEGKTQNPFENCKYELVKLGEIVKDLGKGKRPASFADSNGEYNFYKSSLETYKCTAYDFDTEAIIIGDGGCANIHYHKGKFSATDHAYIFEKLNDEISLRYIYFVIRNNLNLLQVGFKGIGLQNIAKNFIKEQVKIPLPPLEIQKQIVSECEKVEEQYNTIRMSIEKYQELIKAILVKCGIIANTDKFIGGGGATRDSETSRLIASLLKSIQELESKLDLKAFLDSIPTPPPHGWERVKLGQIVSVQSGGTPSREVAEYWNGNINWIKSEVCQNCYVYENQVKEKITELGLRKSSAKILKKDSILIALVGATIGKIGYLTFDSTTNQNIAGLYPLNRENLNTKFLYFACLGLYRLFTEKGGFTMANLTFIKNLKIPLPPIKTQEKIVNAIESVESQIKRMDSKLEVLEKAKAEILANALNKDYI